FSFFTSLSWRSRSLKSTMTLACFASSSAIFRSRLTILLSLPFAFLTIRSIFLASSLWEEEEDEEEEDEADEEEEDEAEEDEEQDEEQEDSSMSYRCLTSFMLTPGAQAMLRKVFWKKKISGKSFWKKAKLRHVCSRR